MGLTDALLLSEMCHAAVLTQKTYSLALPKPPSCLPLPFEMLANHLIPKKDHLFVMPIAGTATIFEVAELAKVMVKGPETAGITLYV